jgi:hypothetical protein
MADHIEAIRRNPRCAASYAQFAWLWIAWPDVRMREARLGIELARKACELSDWAEWSCLATLAAAHAEVGELAEASQFAQQALDAAPQEAAAECRLRLQSYHIDRPLGTQCVLCHAVK